ncbi:MAG: hypothetical protein KGJ05_08500, partial [Alphaproteobacteria bacterium]|nr:hypothetical protein [Alphaproteobacteria bacterium]
CAPPELAAQGQSWLVLMVSGFGQAIGSKLSGEVHAAFVAPHAALGAIAWTPLLLLPVFLGVMTSAIWILLFPSKPKQQRNAA